MSEFKEFVGQTIRIDHDWLILVIIPRPFLRKVAKDSISIASYVLIIHFDTIFPLLLNFLFYIIFPKPWLGAWGYALWCFANCQWSNAWDLFTWWYLDSHMVLRVEHRVDICSVCTLISVIFCHSSFFLLNVLLSET